MTWIIYVVLAILIIYMMFKGGGCCGGGHSNHGGHGDSHGGGCCGGDSNTDTMSNKGHKGHDPRSTVNSTNMDMAEDPICGMYVSKHSAISRKINGNIYYFCSENCAKEFERRQ